MKSAKMVMLAGGLLAVVGCSQPHRAGTGTGMGMEGQGHGMGMMAGNGGYRDGMDHAMR